MRMSRYTLFHRAYAALLFIGILALLITTLMVIGTSVTRSSPHRVSQLEALAASGDKLTPEQTLELSRPTIGFVAEKLTPADQRLKGTIEISVPPGVPAQLQDRKTKHAVFDCSGSGSCTPLPGYENRVLNVTMYVTSVGGGSDYEFNKNIPLKAIYANSVLGKSELPVEIPLTGFPERYPQDTYSFNVSLDLEFVGMDRLYNGKPATGKYADQREINGGTVASAYNVSSKPQPGYNDSFSITISRPTSNQFYIYAVALVPFLFSLLFMHLLYFSRHSHERDFEHFAEALVLSVLAVLPLRVVLVPADIDGLTRVDLMLGLGLVLIVAIAIGKYAGEIWSRAAPNAPHEVHTSVPLHVRDLEATAPPMPAGE